MPKQLIWMKVTDDEYELPVAVARSSGELAQILGIPVDTIHSNRKRYKAGLTKKLKYVAVEEGDEDAVD